MHNNAKKATQLAFVCSNLTMETPEQCVKSVNNKDRTTSMTSV